ncbi:MAG: hypothetical protein B6I37_08550 [Desulfobacteraceae bacterium 4572_35.2]|nr:MAG: hypothetical protein B6I37_08550 [Desulfobacteraceae bacterium 4572_35.2]
MLVNRDQKAVFLLAHLVLRNNKLSIPALLSGQAIHYKKGSHPDMLDWAIEYIQCYPTEPLDQKLLHHMHLDPGYQWTPEQTRQVSVGVKSFYAKLTNSRLYAIGLRWLNSGGRTIIENYTIAQYAPPSPLTPHRTSTKIEDEIQ